MAKKVLFLVLLVCLCLSAVFSSDVYLTEGEYQELLNIIKTSEGNSKAQQRLIAGLRKTLREQEAELQQALNVQEMLQAELQQALDTLNRSDADLTVLRDTLSRIRSYSDGLIEYCSTLENEKGRLKSENLKLQIGAGVSGGAAGILAIILLLVLL